MNILSINFNHDGAGVILTDGKPSAYVNTERYSRKKKHPGIRDADLDELLDQAGLKLEDIAHVMLCNLNLMDSPDIPYTHGSNLKDTWFDFWINATYTKVRIRNCEISCTVNPGHMSLHAALVYYTSPFDSAAILTWDPTGLVAFEGRGTKLTRINKLRTEFNSCNFYNDISAQLFETGLFGAGKLMGLAPYGDVVLETSTRSNWGAPFTRQDKKKPVVRKGREASKPFDYPAMVKYKNLVEHSQKDPVFYQEKDKKLNATLAYNAQRLMEEQLIELMEYLYKYCIEEKIDLNICISGGAALNSVANQVAFLNSSFKDMFLHPACGDDGTAIGAALLHWHNVLGKPRNKFSNRELMYSVRTYENRIAQFVEKEALNGKIIVEKTDDYIAKTADLISKGHIIGWFQEGSEIGPRALGNRSILADPRHPDMKDILNAKVKFREGFRPFAPSVLNEHAQEYFGINNTPFMLRVCDVLKGHLPSITHVDGTARVQTVTPDDNPNYYRLIKAFHEITGVPIIIDTSFNIKGEPIVETPEDAMRCFLNTQIEHLVFPNYIISKK
jgi:carbamoyltransferase